MSGGGAGRRLARIGLATVAAWVTACAVLVTPGGASKAKKVATTASKLTVVAGSVSGSVYSHRSECKRGREVTLRSTATGKTALDTAKTDRKGRWEMTISLGPGTYFADIESATRHGKQNGVKVKFQCRAVKSAPTTI